MRQYTVYNRCPTPIDLYIGGTKQGTIPTDGNVVKTLGTGAGYFFTDANGGSQNANGTIHAGFYDVSPNSFTMYSEMDDSSGLLLHHFGPKPCQHWSASEAHKSQSALCDFSHKLFPFTSLTSFGNLEQFLL